MTAELGEGTDQAFEKLDAAIQKQPQDAGLYYDAACAYALASQPLAKKDPAKGRDRAERAIRLLRTAIQNGYSDYNHMQEDSDLDPLRELPAFAVIMKAGHLDRFYAAVWAGDFRFEASPLFGLDTAAQLQQCRELVAQGYRMVALSVARTSPGGPPITASVWHRPVITEETKDQLAQGKLGRGSHWFAWAKLRKSGPSCGTVPTPVFGASSSTGSALLEPTPGPLSPNWNVSLRPPSRPPPGKATHGCHPLPPRDFDAAGADPGAGDIREGGPVFR